MNNRAKKILTLISINLLLLGTLASPGAAAEEKAKKKSPLPPQLIQIGFMVALSVTGLAVVLGTGKSMKYNGNAEESPEEGSEAKAEPANSHQDGDDILVHNTQDSNAENWETQQISAEENLVVPSNSNGNGNGNGHSANEMEVATSEEHLIELQKQLYRQRYQKFQQEVHQSSEFANSPTKEVDTWEVDVEIALKVLSESPDDRQEVEKVLLQSDQVKEWESLLPEPEYKAKAAEYIERAYNWAQDLRKWREKHISA